MAKNIDIFNHMDYLKDFIGVRQLFIIAEGLKGEEKMYFSDMIIELATRIKYMPKTYEQDGKGMDAIAYLHYFHGNMDWYITEKDMGDEQIQAYGFADIGYGGELGYIPIVELIENNVEFDLHFTPKPLKDLVK